MKSRYLDPFTPDIPVSDPARFSGRRAQVELVVDSLYQLKHGKPTSTIITGDRGIGKSSLLNQAKELAQGDNSLPARLEIDIGAPKYDFIIAWHDAAKDQGPREIVSGVMEELQSVVKSVFAKLKIEINLGGALKVSQKETDARDVTGIVNHFCTEISKVAARAKEHGKDGVLIFVDELDRANPTSGIATFFKLVIEKLSRDKVTNVAFFCAGITGAIQNLEEEHASIYRTFKEVPVPRLEAKETAEILRTGYDKVCCEYDERVLSAIHKLAAGYPEPVHLLGSQTLAIDSDDSISIEDVEAAKIQTIETLRRNKLNTILRRAGSGKYQKILQAMAEHEGDDVPLTYISQKIGHTQNQYSSNMGNLQTREVIIQRDRGVYAFVDPLLKEYIKRFGVFSIEADDDKEPLEGA
jgi:hypothetical protein